MDLYLLLRLAKVCAVGVLFTGCIGALFARDLAERRRFAYFLAGPGFGATWALGFGLVSVTSTSLLSWWVLGGFALSMLSLQAVLFSVGREGRRTVVSALFVLVPLVATAWLMIFRPG